MDSDPETEEDFLDSKAEPVEDDPPNLAVEGFRPIDYTRDNFHIGLRDPCKKNNAHFLSS